MLQIYTGNGKGKTSAALGVALRAAGAGMRVLFIQFMKNTPTSELETLKALENKITVKQFGSGAFVINTPTEKDFHYAGLAFAEIENAAAAQTFDVIIADELCTAAHYKLIDSNKIVTLIKNCPQSIELIFTGRYAGNELINAADVVTEMREIKHCFNNNIPARKGIEY